MICRPKPEVQCNRFAIVLQRIVKEKVMANACAFSAHVPYHAAQNDERTAGHDPRDP